MVATLLVQMFQFPINATEIHCHGCIISAACNAYRDENPTFTLFSRLPLEIRNMVYQYALPPPRTITIFAPFNTDPTEFLLDTEIRAKAIPNPTPPHMSRKQGASSQALRSLR
ncbi:hypothetical protein DL98DRAFT_598799 [Cadophora sp. DSE1049]|nr:hypothetical protein DL98DRAFT_598799 [Cadophora sp. DSE1049]